MGPRGQDGAVLELDIKNGLQKDRLTGQVESVMEVGARSV